MVIRHFAKSIVRKSAEVEGRVLGFVETPDRLEIFEIGEDYILGRSWDEMYVEYVQLWALER